MREDNTIHIKPKYFEPREGNPESERKEVLVRDVKPIPIKLEQAHQSLHQRNADVQTQEEYAILLETIKQQGGYVSHTNDFNDGISVQYMIPVEEK